MNYPKIYLAIDNCFASKRWVSPDEWMPLIKSLGIHCIEASSDNECDPLYMGAEYLNDWKHQVLKSAAEHSMKVVNLYSGHGTYATLGLSHPDRRVRDRILYEWLMPMSRLAGELGAGLGFYCHAFSDAILQNVSGYEKAMEDLYCRLAMLSKTASDFGYGPLGIEQMYSPHQIPWTIEGAKVLLREVYQRSNAPFYITIDVGHQSGQKRFLRPTASEIKELLSQRRCGKPIDHLWLGPERAFALFEEAAAGPKSRENDFLHAIQTKMDETPHLFSSAQDSDPYGWLTTLGCYSPIIHLQQTNGKTSSHLPFTKEHNASGIILPDKLLRALAASYNQTADETMPPPCSDIYLTLEMFTPTAEINRVTLMRLAETVAYWRRFVPEDGISLDQLIH